MNKINELFEARYSNGNKVYSFYVNVYINIFNFYNYFYYILLYLFVIIAYKTKTHYKR